MHVNCQRALNPGPWAKSRDLGREGAQGESPGYVEVCSMIPGSDVLLFFVRYGFCLL